jgi:hypothetical protein
MSKNIKQINFSHKETIEALLRAKEIHEGIWELNVNFGFVATNVDINNAPTVPGAIVSVINIGLARQEKESILSIDASKIKWSK